VVNFPYRVCSTGPRKSAIWSSFNNVGASTELLRSPMVGADNYGVTLDINRSSEFTVINGNVSTSIFCNFANDAVLGILCNEMYSRHASSIKLDIQLVPPPPRW